MGNNSSKPHVASPSRTKPSNEMDRLRIENEELRSQLTLAQQTIANLVQRLQTQSRGEEVFVSPTNPNVVDGPESCEVLYEVHVHDTKNNVVSCTFVKEQDTVESLFCAVATAANRLRFNAISVIEVLETNDVLVAPLQGQNIYAQTKIGGMVQLRQLSSPIHIRVSTMHLQQAPPQNGCDFDPLPVAWTEAKNDGLSEHSLFSIAPDVLHHLAQFLTSQALLSLAATCTTARTELLQRQRDDVPWQFIASTHFPMIPRAHAFVRVVDSFHPFMTTVEDPNIIAPVRLESHLALLRANEMMSKLIRPFAQARIIDAIRKHCEPEFPPIATDIAKLAPGQIVEACDTVNKWYDATVLSVSEDGEAATVHYNCWGNKWDEEIKLDAKERGGTHRVQLLGTNLNAAHTRSKLFMNSDVRGFLITPDTIRQQMNDFVHVQQNCSMFESSVGENAKSIEKTFWLDIIQTLFSHVVPTDFVTNATVNDTTSPRQLITLLESKAFEGQPLQEMFSSTNTLSLTVTYHDEELFPEAKSCSEEFNRLHMEKRKPDKFKLMQSRVPLQVVDRERKKKQAEFAQVREIIGYVLFRPNDGFGVVFLRYGAHAEHYNR